jgi:hypothetical protein
MLFGGRGEPSRSDLLRFGVSLSALLAAAGGLVLWRTGSWPVAAVLWAAAAAFAAGYFLLPALRRPLYGAWETLTAPIGWTLSYLVLGIVYYLVLTPVGLLLRLAGRDPLERAREEGRPSYWVERQPTRELGRYFRQS